LKKKTVFRTFPACQIPEIVLNESSKDTENALIEWLRSQALKFKNIILEEKLSNKFKNGHKNFFHVSKSLNFMVLGYTSTMKSQNLGNSYA
jgi:hypothetical protein